VSKVLLVEDDFSLRDIYSARFQAEGYTLVTASDGEEALATAMREHPDLIVLDVMMPKISGFDVLDILRSTPETKDTKVIMMTALSQETDRQRGEALGVNKYLVKSQVTLEDVVATVKQVLGNAAAASTAAAPGTVPPTGSKPAPASPPPAPTPTPPPSPSQGA
jgi:DNA-binding response OmpR family regulator